MAQTPLKKKKKIQKTAVALSIAFEGKHICILNISQRKCPITNQIDGN